MSHPPAARALFKRNRSARPLADLVLPCIGTVLARQGFGEADILLHWPEIVGPMLAEHCKPLKLQWRARGTKVDPAARIEPATLIVRVESAFAIALQHMAPVVVDKVNVHLGWRAVGKLALRQGPLPQLAPKGRAKAPFDAKAQARAAKAAEAIGDDALRAALVKLGSLVLSGKGPSGG